MNTLFMILKFVPVVIQTVVAVEAALRGNTGDTKKNVVVDSISAAASAIGKGLSDMENDALHRITDSTVGVLNDHGVFNKTANGPTPSVTVKTQTVRVK